MGVILPLAPLLKHNQGKATDEGSVVELGSGGGGGGRKESTEKRKAVTHGPDPAGLPDPAGSPELLGRLALKAFTLRLQPFSLWAEGFDCHCMPTSDSYKGKLCSQKFHTPIPDSSLSQIKHARKQGRREGRRVAKVGGRETETERNNSQL